MTNIHLLQRLARKSTVRDRMKHIIAAFASLNPYRIRIEDGSVRFVPDVLCDRNF